MSDSFGRGELARLSPALQLDLKRLRKIASKVGDKRLALRLFWNRQRPETQLHMINQYLGDRLANASARQRSDLSHAFALAEAVLPPDVRTPRTIPAEAASMREVGCSALGPCMTPDEVQAILDYLRSKPLLLGHVPGAAKGEVASIDAVTPDSNYACYRFLDLWSSPGLIRFAAQDRFLDIAQAYLGCTPTLYSINAFWSFPNRQPHKASQVFHRDWEDYRSLALFTQLTPVDVPEDGAHYYVETSNELDRFERTLRGRGVSARDIDALSVRDETVIAPLAMKLFREDAHRFDGPAGISFCTDGYGLHRAEVPHTRPRLLLWLRFGNFFNDTMYAMDPGHWDPTLAAQVLKSIPSTPRQQYVFRYMIKALTSVRRPQEQLAPAA